MERGSDFKIGKVSYNEVRSGKAEPYYPTGLNGNSVIRCAGCGGRVKPPCVTCRMEGNAFVCRR